MALERLKLETLVSEPAALTTRPKKYEVCSPGIKQTWKGALPVIGHID